MSDITKIVEDWLNNHRAGDELIVAGSFANVRRYQREIDGKTALTYRFNAKVVDSYKNGEWSYACHISLTNWWRDEK